MKFSTKLLGAVAGLAMAVSSGAAFAEPHTMGVSIPTADHGWTGGVNYHARVTKERLEALYPDLKIVLVTAADPTSQANDLEDLVSIHEIEALVILPTDGGPLTEPIRDVKASGATITVVDRSLTDNSLVDIYVAGNNPELGTTSAKYMAEHMNGTGNIVILRGLPISIDEERFDAFMAEIGKSSGITVLDNKHANWNRDDGFTVMQDFLARFPKIDGVWAQDDDIALGVIEAVKEAGREEELFIVGGAGMKEMVKRVMDGDKLVPVDVLYPPAMIATAMEITALQFVSGAPVEGTFIVGSPLITQENAAKYYFPDSLF
uniref:ABC transporter substrate-binding protein n=1 Tax=OCS116 cluster bacterium TaxID=2030921 RepID=A0A2A4YS40_9PROT